jgi:hypothetical protein
MNTLYTSGRNNTVPVSENMLEHEDSYVHFTAKIYNVKQHGLNVVTIVADSISIQAQ